jgi:hypothetical protein
VFVPIELPSWNRYSLHLCEEKEIFTPSLYVDSCDPGVEMDGSKLQTEACGKLVQMLFASNLLNFFAGISFAITSHVLLGMDLGRDVGSGCAKSN